MLCTFITGMVNVYRHHSQSMSWKKPPSPPRLHHMLVPSLSRPRLFLAAAMKNQFIFHIQCRYWEVIELFVCVDVKCMQSSKSFKGVLHLLPWKAPKLARFVFYLKIINIFFEKYMHRMVNCPRNSKIASKLR